MQEKNNAHEKQLKEARALPHVVEVAIALECARAKEVFLCGDFNHWSPTGLRMIRREGNGRWEKRLTLPPGRYQYKFTIDGEWIADPAARENVANPFGSVNSVMEVLM